MKTKLFFYYFPAVLVFFIGWDCLAKLAQLPILPTPESVILRMIKIFPNTILYHLLYSLGRIIAGLTLAIIIGIPLGVLLGYTKLGDKFLSPMVYLLYPIPKIALLPIVMLIFGIGELPKILIIFLIVIFQILVTLRDTISKIPQEVFYPIKTLGGSFLTIFHSVLWPASLPSFLSSLRIALGTAISVLFFTETFGTVYGMGYFIMDAWLRVNYLDMYAGIVVLSLMGLGLFTCIDLLEYRLCAWKK